MDYVCYIIVDRFVPTSGPAVVFGRPPSILLLLVHRNYRCAWPTGAAKNENSDSGTLLPYTHGVAEYHVYMLDSYHPESVEMCRTYYHIMVGIKVTTIHRWVFRSFYDR